MPKVSREEIEKKFIAVVKEIRHNKKTEELIIDRMSKFNYLAGDVQGFITNTEKEVEEMDIRTICLMLEVIHETTTILEALPDLYFTETEIQRSRQFTGDLQREDRITLPLTLDGVYEVGKRTYSTIMSAKLIKQLMDSMLLTYNFETQREATRKKKGSQIIYEPTVNPNNIIEITEHLRNGTLLPNALIFNAGRGSNRKHGKELVTNRDTNQLTLLDKTKLDIVDGYHRCQAVQNALDLDPTIEYNFIVTLINFSEKEAQMLLGQMSKAMPISEAKARELTTDKLSDEVVSDLKRLSELKGKISQYDEVDYSLNEIVKYSTLSDAIDDIFKLKSSADVIEAKDILTDFFNYLIGSFENEFKKHIEETHNISLINDSDIIAYGYVTLAKRMEDEGIKIRKLKGIINDIDFSRDNNLWVENKILNKNGKLVKNAHNNIKKYFEELDLKEKVR